MPVWGEKMKQSHWNMIINHNISFWHEDSNQLSAWKLYEFMNTVRFRVELEILSLLTGGSFIALHNHIVLIVFLWNLLLKVSYEKH